MITIILVFIALMILFGRLVNWDDDELFFSGCLSIIGTGLIIGILTVIITPKRTQTIETYNLHEITSDNYKYLGTTVIYPYYGVITSSSESIQLLFIYNDNDFAKKDIVKLNNNVTIIDCNNNIPQVSMYYEQLKWKNLWLWLPVQRKINKKYSFQINENNIKNTLY